MGWRPGKKEVFSGRRLSHESAQKKYDDQNLRKRRTVSLESGSKKEISAFLKSQRQATPKKDNSKTEGDADQIKKVGGRADEGKVNFKIGNA